MISAAAGAPWDGFNARARQLGWPMTCDPGLAFESPRLIEILRLWQLACGRRAVPRRTDLTTRILGAKLHDCVVIDLRNSPTAPRRYRVRLQGRNVAQHTGDLMGREVDDFVPLHLRERWYTTFDTVLAACAPLRFLMRLEAFGLGEAECLIAPLGDGMGNPVALLVSFALR
ncbi:MAG: PAS domain-containing protein [Proteobacteria bacterium]|nr:PAS domain-containing protein [Pseudomonadota bacterium]